MNRKTIKQSILEISILYLLVVAASALLLILFGRVVETPAEAHGGDVIVKGYTTRERENTSILALVVDARGEPLQGFTVELETAGGIVESVPSYSVSTIAAIDGDSPSDDLNWAYNLRSDILRRRNIFGGDVTIRLIDPSGDRVGEPIEYSGPYGDLDRDPAKWKSYQYIIEWIVVD